LDYSFEVVTDVAEIAMLNKRLGKQLEKVFRIRREREITYPSGHFKGIVYFESASGANVRAWSPFSGDNKLGNFLLSGDPASSHWMEIDVQLNFPTGTYNRKMAGAFVRDSNGDVFVAHRGKLTKGRAGLKKAKVFREFASRTIEAHDGNRSSRLILIAALDASELADRLWEFAEEAREVATRIGAEQDDETEDETPPSGNSPKPVTPGKKTPSVKDPMLRLRDYFDEYAGEGHSKGHGSGKRTVEHGDIVRALEVKLRSTGSSQKAQAIDLAIVAMEVDLFEVKTSARTTDVYTGVGQLLIHGECIHDVLGLPVRRHLVLPTQPRESHCKPITKKAGINIVTFAKDGAGYRFEGLP
jgi:hypothetical protein